MTEALTADIAKIGALKVISSTSAMRYKGARSAGARELAAQSELGYVSPFHVATAYAWAEERDDTFLWLEKAYEVREPLLAFLRREPRWDGFRDDPRFQDLLRRMNFPE